MPGNFNVFFPQTVYFDGLPRVCSCWQSPLEEAEACFVDLLRCFADAAML